MVCCRLREAKPLRTSASPGDGSRAYRKLQGSWSVSSPAYPRYLCRHLLILGIEVRETNPIIKWENGQGDIVAVSPSISPVICVLIYNDESNSEQWEENLS